MMEIKNNRNISEIKEFLRTVLSFTRSKLSVMDHMVTMETANGSKAGELPRKS